MSYDSYERLIRRITNWAQTTDHIQAVIIVGSRARPQESFDFFSDLDLIIFTSAVEELTLYHKWISELGRVWIADLDKTGPGDPEWFVVFENGQKADFLIAQAQKHLNLGQLIQKSPYRQVLMKGWQILFNRWGSPSITEDDLGIEVSMSQVEASELIRHINRTLILAHRAAKFIGRHERWYGQLMLSKIRQHLLWLIEEHARISTSGEVDTWYDGRFIEQWAAPSIKERLPDIFAQYDLKDMARALHAILSMAHQMASDIAKYNEIPYPTAGQKATFDWLISVVIPPD